MVSCAPAALVLDPAAPDVNATTVAEISGVSVATIYKSYRGKRGSLTEPGRVFVLLGSPHTAGDQGRQSMSAMSDALGASYLVTFTPSSLIPAYVAV